MKKMLIAALAVVLAGCGGKNEEVVQGTRGTTSWQFTPDGTLSIGGYGVVECPGPNEAMPWEHLRSRITAITFGDRIVEIGRNWLYDFPSLKTIAIPASVAEIQGFDFKRCPQLASIDVAAGNRTYASDEGVLFDKSRKTLLRYPPNRAGIEYTIPQSVETIGNLAFGGSRLSKITIPQTVDLFHYVFDGCSELESITLPQGTTILGDGLFWGCGKLKTVVIPEGVIHIGISSFGSCTTLQSLTIPSTVTSIGKYAFINCGSLTDITCLAEYPPTLHGEPFWIFRDSAPLTLHVPAGSVRNYRGNPAWSESFADIVAI